MTVDWEKFKEAWSKKTVELREDPDKFHEFMSGTPRQPVWIPETPVFKRWVKPQDGQKSCQRLPRTATLASLKALSLGKDRE